MKRPTWILAGTALGLLMAAPLAAAPAVNLFKKPEPLARDAERAPVILAQAEETEAEKRKKRREQRQKQREESGEEAPAAEEAPAEEAPREEAPAEPAPEPRAEEPAPEPRAEEPAPEAPAAEEPAPEPRAEEPAPEPRAEEPAAEEAPAEEAAPKAERERPKNREKPAKREDQPATEEAPAEEAPAETEAPAGRDAPTNNDVPADVEMTPDGSGTAPADGEAAPADESRETRPEGEAPVLDSQKETAPADADAPAEGRNATDGDAPADGEAAGRTNRNTGDRDTTETAPADKEVAPPESDAAAQSEEIRPREIEKATAEEGRRIERRPEDERRERPEGTEVLREIGDRIVIQFGENVFVESNDRPRIARGARDVYYEELSRGRVREVIVRENGVQIITVRNRYGDVIRRTRISPDGREYVLVYVDEDNYDRVVDWRDPGLDLPPMRLTIPVEEYILESERVDDPDVYYTFLEQPPVERVERLYSIDEVKRSARIRDKTRRIDLDTINFEFGSAEIADGEIDKLSGVADAMLKLLEKNPAETFLIEGHTDAVGSDMANLALSDERAEAVAAALTNVFEIPPENLATQGYGEQYLKVNTGGEERENRRVAMRRITPLVAPVASAN